MKKGILSGLLLLTVFCNAPVFAQRQKSDLMTGFIKLKNIKLGSGCSSFMNCCSFNDRTKNIFNLLRPALSPGGAAEVDTRSNVLIVTDVEKRIKLQKELIGILDDSNLNPDEAAANSSNTEKKISGEISFRNLKFSFLKDTTNGVWQEKQASMLISVIGNLEGNFEINSESVVFTITDTRKRIEIIKKLVELFDQPFLEDGMDYYPKS